MTKLVWLVLATGTLFSAGCFRAVRIPGEPGERAAVAADITRRTVEIFADDRSNGTQHWLVVRVRRIDQEAGVLEGTVREDYVRLESKAMHTWVAVPDSYGKTIRVEFRDMTTLNVLGMDGQIAGKIAADCLSPRGCGPSGCL